MRAGNGLAARERRLAVLRAVQAGALPRKALVVSEPTSGLVRDGWPCAEGPAQARSLLGPVLETGHAGDLWLQDRHVCPCALLGGIDSRGAGCLTRQQAGLPFEVIPTRRPGGRIETGQVAAHRGQVWEA